MCGPPTIASSHVLFPFSGGGPCVCPVCGVSYSYWSSLREHLKKHTGKTTCPMCQQTFGMVHHMRRHMVNVHGMAKEEVDKITKKRRYVNVGDVAP